MVRGLITDGRGVVGRSVGCWLTAAAVCVGGSAVAGSGSAGDGASGDGGSEAGWFLGSPVGSGAASRAVSPDEAARLFVNRPGEVELTGRLLVVPVEGGDDRAAASDQAARARLAPMVLTHDGRVDAYVVRVPAGRDDRAAARELAATGDYAVVAPDWRVWPVGTPNDPLFDRQWHHERIGSAAAWQTSTGSPEIVLAVCDTGVDLIHPDLSLVEGANVVGTRPATTGILDGRVADLNGHGTHVGGHLAAIGDNGQGVVGGGWDFRLMPVRVSDRPDGDAFLSDLIEGAGVAVDMGARVVNVSYSGVQNPTVGTIGAYVENQGGLLFWAAGNGRQDWSFFDHEFVVVVGATTERLRDDGSAIRASFSAFGLGVDVFAPGTNTWSTRRGAGYGRGSGTSFASPIAAGVAALAWSVDPSMTPDLVRRIVYETSTDQGAPGEDAEWGWGEVNAARAVERAIPPTSAPSAPRLVSPRDGATPVLETLELSWAEASGADWYFVELSETGSFEDPLRSIRQFGGSVRVERGLLDYDERYYWRVVSWNRAGEASSAVFDFLTRRQPDPATPVMTSPPDRSGTPFGTNPRFQWLETDFAEGYRVEVREAGGKEVMYAAETEGARSVSHRPPERTLAYRSEYEWRVTALNQSGETASAVWHRFVTGEQQEPQAFELVWPDNGEPGSETGPRFEWSPSVHADEYVLVIADNPQLENAAPVEPVAAPATSLTLPHRALEYGTSYWWRVVARNTSGEIVGDPVRRRLITKATPPTNCEGDTDADYDTDAADFFVVAQNFGTRLGATRGTGDLNGDGAVNIDDMVVLALDFSCDDPPSSEGAAAAWGWSGSR